MAHYLHHEPCPRCGSRDNRAVYSDGSTWCFGCRTYTQPTMAQFREVGVRKQKEWPTFSPTLPEIALEYLRKYGLPTKNWYWSEETGRLCWQQSDFLIGRLLDTTITGPKWYIWGKKPILHFGSGSTVYLVEDLISAMVLEKRGKASIPLFGISVPRSLEQEMRDSDNRYILWLDKDKFSLSIVTATKLSQFTKHPVGVESTELDPKDTK